MKRAIRARITAFLLGALAVAAGFALKFAGEAADLRRTLQYERSRALSDLSESVGDIADTMEKGRYISSPPLLAALSAEIRQEAEAARVSLSELPLDCAPLDNTCRFLAQAGDYAFCLLRRAAAGEGLRDEDRASLDSLAQAARSYAASLAAMTADADNGILLFQPNTDGARTVSAEMSSLEGEFPEYASLIYDGPLSDHVERAVPAMTADAPEITAEEARAKAAAFADVPESALALTGEQGGNLPAYCFAGEDEDGRVYVEVTRNGGYVVNLLRVCEAVEPRMDAADAVELARTFLEERGFADMKESYWLDEAGIVTVNFSAADGDVILYPDLVKVGVELENGRIVRCEARGYLMNHRERALEPAAVSAEEAQEGLDARLTVENTALALIPTDGGNEVLCHEFLCRAEDGRRLLVYCGADDGQERQVLILTESENGTLTK